MRIVIPASFAIVAVSLEFKDFLKTLGEKTQTNQKFAKISCFWFLHGRARPWIMNYLNYELFWMPDTCTGPYSTTYGQGCIFTKATCGGCYNCIKENLFSFLLVHCNIIGEFALFLYQNIEYFPVLSYFEETLYGINVFHLLSVTGKCLIGWYSGIWL